MAIRQLVSRSVIDEWMTKKLRDTLGYEACQLSLSYRLLEPDSEGCNWSSVLLRCGSDIDCDDHVLLHARQIVPSIYGEARQLFNLADNLDATNLLKGSIELAFTRRLLHLPVFHIDTNLINARQKIDEVNRLEHWNENGVILINMSWTAHAEAQADGNSQRSKKASSQIYTIDMNDIDANLSHQVGTIIFPAGIRDKNQLNDVRIVCEAAKYKATLITKDGASRNQPGGILGSRERLQDITGIRILSPEEAVQFVELKIKERDDFNKCVAQDTGMILPDWTDKD